jgi:hypothetical protein
LSQSTIHTLIGLFLFATGLVALVAVSSPSPALPVAPTTADATAQTVPTTAPDRMEGVGFAVEEVLLGSGRAGDLSAVESSQIPPQVLRILADNGVVLTIPERGGE